ncbi:hypothetical protein JCM3774_004849 [Rhodotorula dairenensis]
METCGTCMVAHPEDPNERLPRYGLAGVAAYFEEQCGRAVDLPGLTPQESLAASLSLPVTTLASASSSTQQASADAAAAPSSASPAQTAVETTTTMSSSTSSSSLSGSPGFATVSAASQLVSTSATVAAATAASADSSPVTSTPDKIAQTGKLSDRIARLGLGSPAGSPTSPSTASLPSRSPDSVRTGAVSRVSDKISRFQAQAEDRPLLPEGGSFGLAPAKPRSSTGGGVGGGANRDRYGDDRQRVVSLGVGRAPVPLGVVTPRSVSATASPDPSLGGSTQSIGAPSLSRSSSVSSTRPSGVKQARIEAPAATEGGEETTPVASPTESREGSPAARNAAYLDALPPIPRTPGAASVSSMRVETGSIASEGRASTTDFEVSASDLPTPTDSPLSSPIISGLTVPTSATPSVSSADGIAPAVAPTLSLNDLKGPLRNLSRPGSVVSVSSLTVEAPSEDEVADASAISTKASSSTFGTPTPAEALASEVPDTEGQTGENEERSRETDETEAERIERTRQELAQYERDVEDPPVPSPFAAPGERSNGDGDGGAPVEPPLLREELIDRTGGNDSGQGNDATASLSASPPRKSSPIPDVKCSDCGQEVPLLELADHSCEKADVPVPTTPPAASTPLAAPVPVVDAPRPDPDVPDEPLEDDILDPDTTASGIAARAEESSKADKLDAFVPQTEELVPEDVLDLYDDHDPHVEEDCVGSQGLSTLPQSTTNDDKVKREGTGGLPRSTSTDLPLPGRYYTSDDEDHGEPGSATIVRSPSSK